MSEFTKAIQALYGNTTVTPPYEKVLALGVAIQFAGRNKPESCVTKANEFITYMENNWDLVGTENKFVPNVVTMTQVYAENYLGTLGFTTSHTHSYHPSITAGDVISSNPVAGVVAAIGSEVALLISDGPEP